MGVSELIFSGNFFVGIPNSTESVKNAAKQHYPILSDELDYKQKNI